MTPTTFSGNRLRVARSNSGMTQAELAGRAGISRSAVAAIEGHRLVPSVAAALSLAEVLDSTVEELFGRGNASDPVDPWAWKPIESSSCYWRAEVGGNRYCYPTGSVPMFTPLPDSTNSNLANRPENTLVIAGCDPASGLLASQFLSATDLRMLVLPRSSRQAVEMLRDGLVHMAGLHLSTQEDPDRNSRLARELLGADVELLRIAGWQEGIATAHSKRFRTVSAVLKARLTWVGRDLGSGARHCLDRLLNDRPGPRRIASSHRGVVEAIQSGWADAGICVQLASAEAGLDFLPVQKESYDLCFRKSFTDDKRCKALLRVVRSKPYRRLLAGLPGYDSRDTGNLLVAR